MMMMGRGREWKEKTDLMKSMTALWDNVRFFAGKTE